MTEPSKSIPVTELSQDTAAVLDQLRTSKRPVIITRRGEAAAVLLSVETYQRAQSERELLYLLARGEQEIAAGKGHDLDAIIAEADALLSEDQS